MVTEGRRFLTGNGHDPDTRFPVPEAFATEFTEDPRLLEVATALIDGDEERFGHLTGVRIRYLWKKAGGTSKGTATWASTQKAPSMVAYFAECDYVIWCAADHIPPCGAQLLADGGSALPRAQAPAERGG